MATQHHKPGTPTLTTRRYTVSYISRRHERRATGELLYYSRSPSLHIKGDWLAALGFETGQKIEVIGKPGQLIVQLAGEK